MELENLMCWNEIVFLLILIKLDLVYGFLLEIYIISFYVLMNMLGK